MSKDDCCDHHGKKGGRDGMNNGAIYGMGFLGALVYYIQHATSFWNGVIGFFKAIFWPAMLIYKLLELWKM
jgi:hypothetical protein